MLIKNIFAKDIERRIDGVIKADQRDQESLWLELDEFVVTAEVRKHVSGFFNAVKDAQDHPNDPAMQGRTGVWISGFFGSGKSMLLKIISLMIENEEVTANGKTQQPLDFILPRIGNALMAEDIAACCGKGTEALLFNIDAKGDSSKGDAAVLDVFYRVFNEHRGRCADPDVAEFEDGLAQRGWLQDFVSAFESISKNSWPECSRKYLLYQDRIATALAQAGGLSTEEAKRQAAGIKGLARLTPDAFAQAVADYLKLRGPNARLMLFVDEVGQFVGKNGRLMLNLQTITEELGVKTKGRAWVVVTAQEDVEAIIGELNRDRAYDFSKIQGRFYTKLKLSSSNADEVLQKRLLQKNEAGAHEIDQSFSPIADILRNAITFKAAGMTFRKIGDAKEFATDYPFVAYQFQLVPRIFSAIRKRGATGQHLAEGERSMLDAFQIAAKAIAQQEVGELVPLHGFYPAIESYLEAVVKRTIDQTPQRGLKETSVNLLKTLFLIRWVDEVKGNIETLVTLSLAHMDQDRAKLNSDIVESLQKLEGEMLVSKNGDVYYFLTDEEQAIDKEIRDTNLALGEESREIGKLLFSDVIKQAEKHRFRNGKDFAVARYCDGRPVANTQNPELEVRVLTPYDSEYSLYKEDGKSVLMSAAEQCLLVVLPDDKSMTEEVTKYLKVENYLRTHRSTDLPKETKRIQEDRAGENHDRRTRILKLLQEAFLASKFFISGNQIQPQSSDPTNAFKESLDKLIDNIFSSLGLIKALASNPQADISVSLKSNDVQKQLLEIERSDNREAIAAVKQRVTVLASQSKQINLGDLITDFGRKPYGWPDFETALILARLYIAGEIQFEADGDTLEPPEITERLTKPGKWKQVIIRRKEAVSAEELGKARSLALALFHSAVPSTSEEAAWHIRNEFKGWSSTLLSASHYVNLPTPYPGKAEIKAISAEIEPLSLEKDSFRFLQLFNQKDAALRNLKPSFDEVSGFYSSQRPAWERLLTAYDQARPNESAIRENHPEAAKALVELKAILVDPRPYSRIPEANRLAATLSKANEAVLTEERKRAEASISEIQESLDRAISDLPDETAQQLQKPLVALRQSVETENMTSNLRVVREHATDIYNSIIVSIQQQAKDQGAPPPPKVKPIRTVKPKARTLETVEEVDMYLSDLKQQILAAISEGAKVQVQ